MPIPKTHLMERLSVAYVRAVAATAGARYNGPDDGHEYGKDAHIVRVRQLPNGKYKDTGHVLHCQIKATSDFQIRGNMVVYEMDVDAYNDLVEWEGGSCILILFCLPVELAHWLVVTEDEFTLKKCCYWYRIDGDRSYNSRTQTIYIHRSQLFTPEAVESLLEKVRLGEL